MWIYEKKLLYPVKVSAPNAFLAKCVIQQFGSPGGELGAANRYLAQRYTVPYDQVKAILTDIGTEELGHVEMICAIVHQLTKNLTPQQIIDGGFSDYYLGHTTGLFPVSSGGIPFSAEMIASNGDIVTDLTGDMFAEQAARTTYENILRLCDDPDVRNCIKFLREREIVHYQRFGEALRIVQENLDSKNFYAFNPEFDTPVNTNTKPITKPSVNTTK